MFLYGKYAIRFGGKIKKEAFAFFTKTDMETLETKEVTVRSEKNPSARYYHSTVYYRRKMYVFGGKNGKKYLNDTWAFNFETEKWEELEAVGNIPYPRIKHSLHFYPSDTQNRLILFGGKNGSIYYNDSISFFNLGGNRWSSMTLQSVGYQDFHPVLEKISCHSSFLFHNKLFVFGSFSGFEEENLRCPSIVASCGSKKKNYFNSIYFYFFFVFFFIFFIYRNSSISFSF